MLNEPGRTRILVVDDDVLIRWALGETLSGCGYEVVEAGDAEGAVKTVAAAAVPFDVALLDFRLPDSQDLALMSRLRRLAPSTQIVLMTAYGTPEIVQEALDRGAYRVLSKPFEIQAISPIVTEAHALRS